MTDFGKRLGDMSKSIYDTDNDGVVDDAEKLDGNTKSQVQDHTPKTHTHTESDITDLDHDADKIKSVTVDDADKANTKVLAYNSTSGNLEYETQAAGGPADAIRGDGTANRYLRSIWLKIRDGTDAATLACQVGSLWNGDIIANTDNVAKNATTGHFTLNAAGTTLKIEAAGLSGNVLMAFGVPYLNEAVDKLLLSLYPSGNDIEMSFSRDLDATDLDITTLVDTGGIYLYILYGTDA